MTRIKASLKVFDRACIYLKCDITKELEILLHFLTQRPINRLDLLICLGTQIITFEK